MPGTNTTERVVNSDSISTVINRDNTLVMTSGFPGGVNYATSTATGADTYSGFDACIGQFALSTSPSEPLVYYWLDTTLPKVWKHTLGTSCGIGYMLVYPYPGISSRSREQQRRRYEQARILGHVHHRKRQRSENHSSEYPYRALDRYPALTEATYRFCMEAVRDGNVFAVSWSARASTWLATRCMLL